jgi:NADH-ubiquinone oxidoreductase chain 1
MLYHNVINFILIILFIVPVLLVIAFITIAERKTMASMQRRLGPNIVGYYGTLQPFADALKLLIKEYIAPTQANILLFFLGPLITLMFALFGYVMVPYGPGIAISDFNLGILYMLAVSSIATYGILLAGWSANSKYAFLGSLRSTAQLISYELILSSALLVIVFLTGTFNLTIMVEVQRSIWFILLIFPLYMIFFVASVAETNRAPFDLAEAESELVSGFMTEHSAGIFVFFFLAEYASIILMCILISIVLLGGYEIFTHVHIINNIIILLINYFLDFVNNITFYTNTIINLLITSTFNVNYLDIININTISENHPIIEYLTISYCINNLLLSFIYSSSLSLKSYALVFLFIWVRASFPRLRFDKLMSYCWTELLPTIISIIIFIPCLIFVRNILLYNVSLI